MMSGSYYQGEFLGRRLQNFAAVCPHAFITANNPRCLPQTCRKPTQLPRIHLLRARHSHAVTPPPRDSTSERQTKHHNHFLSLSSSHPRTLDYDPPTPHTSLGCSWPARRGRLYLPLPDLGVLCHSDRSAEHAEECICEQVQRGVSGHNCVDADVSTLPDGVIGVVEEEVGSERVLS